jgi:hypothetical protein
MTAVLKARAFVSEVSPSAIPVPMDGYLAEAKAIVRSENDREEGLLGMSFGEDRAFGLHRGVGRLIEQAPHLAVALRPAMTVVHARALFVAGAGADPRREVLG